MKLAQPSQASLAALRDAARLPPSLRRPNTTRTHLRRREPRSDSAPGPRQDREGPASSPNFRVTGTWAPGSAVLSESLFMSVLDPTLRRWREREKARARRPPLREGGGALAKEGRGLGGAPVSKNPKEWSGSSHLRTLGCEDDGEGSLPPSPGTPQPCPHRHWSPLLS